MALTTGTLVRLEGKLVDAIDDNILAPFITNASVLIQRILKNLEYYPLDERALSEEIYHITYANVADLAAGTGAGYTALIAAINVALAAANQETLTANDQTELKTLGTDFQKTETFLALAKSIIPLGTRPAAKGGFVVSVGAQDGESQMLSLRDLKSLENHYTNEAYETLFPYTKDLNTGSELYPEKFEHPTGSIQFCRGTDEKTDEFIDPRQF